jgi:Fur family transcriptional regulator, ferric uptake regulator
VAENIRERFHAFLKTKRLRITPERDEVLQVVLRNPSHFTATDIHAELQRNGHSTGLATVYRTLPLLLKAGIIREADRRGCKEEQSYERAIGSQHHDHLICEICSRIIEFEEPMIEKLQEKVAEKFGFRLKRHFLDLRGVCAECQKELVEKAIEHL